MALTGTTNPPSSGKDTPITTGTLTAIRQSIRPRTKFWEFELRPWHYWTSIGSAVVIGIAFVVLIATHGAVR